MLSFTARMCVCEVRSEETWERKRGFTLKRCPTEDGSFTQTWVVPHTNTRSRKETMAGKFVFQFCARKETKAVTKHRQLLKKKKVQDKAPQCT